jgi:hypothetical protein
VTEFESIPAADTADRTCAALTICADGQFQAASPTSTSDRTCIVRV